MEGPNYREMVKADLRRMGFTPSEDVTEEGQQHLVLQWEWRKAGCRRDPAEIMMAVLDALTQEGIAAWPGDATSCVEQIVRVQYDRAEKARKDALEDAAARLETVAGQCEAGGHTSRGRMLRALAAEFRQDVRF